MSDPRVKKAVASVRAKLHSFAHPKKSMKPGGGGRFAAGVAKLTAKGESEHEAKAVMAIAGRKKYGAKKMAHWAAAGRK